MKKNVIYIVIDAFCYNNLKLKIGTKEVTPFLNRIMLSSKSFTNIYSQAPYTEASLVSLLGNELPLDCGGYLLGNKNCKETLLEKYQKNGYRTSFTYSPYVYSESYLRGVNKFYYTRLFSIEPLFLYRLSYYKEKWEKNILDKEEIKICILLLEEAFNTWIYQCESLIKNKNESILIKKIIEKESIISEIKLELISQKKNFDLNKNSYIEKIFENFDSHTLRKINSRYNRKKELPLKNELIEKYSKIFEKYQKKYSKSIKNQDIDISYFFNKLTQNKNGFKSGIKDSLKLLKKYLEHYFNLDLKEYLLQTQDLNTEISMKLIFDKFLNEILENDRKNENYFTYIQVQDFHLPSMFHTYDCEDIKLVDEEFQTVFELLENLDENFTGNIIAALSARYCDLKLEKFFESLEKELKNKYLFVITADHGYPSYFNPPRSEIYNQTYKEAFHIPMIIFDPILREKREEKELYTALNGIEMINEIAGIDKRKSYKNNYILCEYGGPGCPAIYEKKIWYVLITKEFIVSLEVALNDKLSKDSIKSIFNIKKDPLQKYNLVKKYKNIGLFLEIVEKRHNELRDKYLNKKFFKNYI